MNTKHFRIRTGERFGRKFKKREIKQIINAIRKNKLKKIKEEPGKNVYSITLDNKLCTVVYNTITEKLITIFINKPETI